VNKSPIESSESEIVRDDGQDGQIKKLPLESRTQEASDIVHIILEEDTVRMKFSFKGSDMWSRDK